MKGLLIKDLNLMKAQKNFFIMIIGVSVTLAFVTKNPSFIIGYMTVFCSMFTLSTISYDDFDNGNAFLFSLPITRKGYVAEKYVFGLMVSVVAWLSATVVYCIAGGFTTQKISEAALIYIALLLVFALMLPVQLKFGGEKGRVAIIGVIGIIAVVVMVIVKAAEIFQIDLEKLLNNLSNLSGDLQVVVALGVAILALAISYFISVAIVNKKEF